MAVEPEKITLQVLRNQFSKASRDLLGQQQKKACVAISRLILTGKFLIITTIFLKKPVVLCIKWPIESSIPYSNDVIHAAKKGDCVKEKQWSPCV